MISKGGVGPWLTPPFCFGQRQTVDDAAAICQTSTRILLTDAAEARRHAVDTVIQGTAADLLKMALIRLHDSLPADVRMLLPVHDSVLLEVPLASVEQTGRIVRNTMETLPAGFSVPLKVDIKTGRG